MGAQVTPEEQVLVVLQSDPYAWGADQLGLKAEQNGRHEWVSDQSDHDDDARQQEQLRLVDAVDARCRQHHVSAESAREALEPLPMIGGTEVDNAWALLRGSNDPCAMAATEVRRLLQP